MRCAIVVPEDYRIKQNDWREWIKAFMLDMTCINNPAARRRSMKKSFN